MKKNFIITAVSDKHNNYCVSGIDCSDYKHYRLVGRDQSIGRALKADYLMYDNHSSVSPLDEVEVVVLGRLEDVYQPENLLVDEKINPRFINKRTKSFLSKLQTNYDHVYFNTERKVNPSILPIHSKEMHSIELIEVQNMNIEVKTWTDRKKVTGTFTYKFKTYKYIAVTDPIVKRKYLLEDDGIYYIGRSLLLITLGEEYLQDGNRYKIIAALYHLSS
ncbi:MAG: Uncharacterized protein FD133_365 [Erysipelotrichaceae bacterium]|nr:MAG: Uncharacterized protein FD133_365 [Erysipelotrichaceae bacterium]